MPLSKCSVTSPVSSAAVIPGGRRGGVDKVDSDGLDLAHRPKPAPRQIQPCAITPARRPPPFSASQNQRYSLPGSAMKLEKKSMRIRRGSANDACGQHVGHKPQGRHVAAANRPPRQCRARSAPAGQDTGIGRPPANATSTSACLPASMAAAARRCADWRRGDTHQIEIGRHQVAQIGIPVRDVVLARHDFGPVRAARAHGHQS